MNEQESYTNVAQLLRERAACLDLPPMQIIQTIKLAEYFEAMSADPAGDLVPDERFG